MELPENPRPAVEEAAGKTVLAGSSGSSHATVLASLFSSSSAASRRSLQSPHPPEFSDLLRAMARPDRAAEMAPPFVFEPLSLCLSSHRGSSILGGGIQERRPYVSPTPAGMSATGLLQKAAQMGAAAASSSVFRGLGLSSTSAQQQRSL